MTQAVKLTTDPEFAQVDVYQPVNPNATKPVTDKTEQKGEDCDCSKEVAEAAKKAAESCKKLKEEQEKTQEETKETKDKAKEAEKTATETQQKLDDKTKE